MAMLFYLKNRAGWVDKTETKIHEERTVTLDLTRIGTDELAAIEHAFIKSNAGRRSGQRNIGRSLREFTKAAWPTIEPGG